jgi:ABC-type transporter Mla MlaB component
MTTTNNLIGYDPLAWLEGEEVSEGTAATPVQEETSEPAKKATKSRAKAKKVEPVEEAVPESVDDEIEVDVSVNEEGEISISIEADSDDEVNVEVIVEDKAQEETVDADNDEMEAIAQEVENETEQETAADEEISPETTEQIPVEAAVEPHIDLEKDATIKNVAALYNTVKNALAAHDVIEINASEVASIDTATLQLLVSLKKDAPNLGKTVEIIYPSERFLESAKLLGLTEILGV